MIEGLYIHIPFCKQICAYCDFPKLVGRPFHMESYVEALEKELSFYKNHLQSIRTIHLGGGTPSSLPIPLLERLLTTIQSIIPIRLMDEYAMEVNPDDLSEAFVNLLAKYQINRVSMGVQSSHNHHLKAMNRSHDFESVKMGVKRLKAKGITNINLDFMFAWPSQTMKELDQDIEEALALNPTHLSFYSLILEEKTILYYNVQHHNQKMPDEDLDASMYERVMKRLPEAGYHHYEISNFAKKGFESQHNLIYWNVKEYLGIGLGAHSQLDNRRFHNFSTLSQYLEAVKTTSHGWQSDDPCDLFQETLLMGLRKIEGVHLPTLNERFNKNPFEVYPGLIQSLNDKLLILENDYLHCTKKGLLLLNVIERNLI